MGQSPVIARRERLMKFSASSLFLIPALLLTACGEKAPPVKLTAAQAAYFGSWEHAGSDYGNNIESDNMLLVFNPDSTVSYKRCINHMSGHNYTTLPDAHIESFTDKQLVFTGGIAFLNFTRKLPIGSPPHTEGDETWMEMDGLKLRKLKP